MYSKNGNNDKMVDSRLLYHTTTRTTNRNPRPFIQQHEQEPEQKPRQQHSLSTSSSNDVIEECKQSLDELMNAPKWSQICNNRQHQLTKNTINNSIYKTSLELKLKNLNNVKNEIKTSQLQSPLPPLQQQQLPNNRIFKTNSNLNSNQLYEKYKENQQQLQQQRVNYPLETESQLKLISKKQPETRLPFSNSQQQESSLYSPLKRDNLFKKTDLNKKPKEQPIESLNLVHSSSTIPFIHSPSTTSSSLLNSPITQSISTNYHETNNKPPIGPLKQLPTPTPRPVSLVNRSESMNSLKSLLATNKTEIDTPTTTVSSTKERKTSPKAWITNSFRKAFNRNNKKSSSVTASSDYGGNGSCSATDDDQPQSQTSKPMARHIQKAKKLFSKSKCASDDERLKQENINDQRRHQIDSDSDYDITLRDGDCNNSDTKQNPPSTSSAASSFISLIDKSLNIGKQKSSPQANIKRTFCSESQLSNESEIKTCASSVDGFKKGIQSNVNLNSDNNNDLILNLKIKLTNTENKLTDIRLEALSSVHHIDQLKECLDKMKNEMISLKSENQILRKYVKDLKTKTIKINNNFNGNDDDGQSTCCTDQDQDEDQDNQHTAILQSYDNLNLNYTYAYNFLLNDENKSILRRAIVRVKCFYNCDDDVDSHEICQINIDSQLKWKLMDGIIVYVFKRYLKLVDPSNTLGLNFESIASYTIAPPSLPFDEKQNNNIERYMNKPLQPQPSLLPFAYLINDNCTIDIILKNDSSNFDSLCHDTLIPKYLLEDYFLILNKYRHLAINGFNKFGKTYLMNKMAKFMQKCNNNHKLDILYYNALNQNENDKLINDLLTITKQQQRQVKIILIDNFHLLLKSFDLFKKLTSNNNVYLIVTTCCDDADDLDNNDNDTTNILTKSSKLNVIDFNNYFKRINLRIECEPICDAILRRYLNKMLIKYQLIEIKSKEFYVLMEKIIQWIINVYLKINEWIRNLFTRQGHYNHRRFELSPLLYIDIPFNIENSEKWFTQLWNYTILPYLSDLFKLFKNKNLKEEITIEDPLKIILNKYPWPSTTCLKERLNKLQFQQFDTSSSVSQPPQSTSLFANYDSTNQRLVSMLVRLQQTTLTSASQPQPNNLKDKKPSFSSGFYDSSNTSTSSSSSSPSPVVDGILPTSKTNTTTVKSKIESSL